MDLTLEKIRAAASAHKDAMAIAILLVISLATSLAFFSPYLYEWDSVQFALALDHFDVAAHQPQPPGYPVYVFFGRLFNLAFADGAVALGAMSGFFGALSLVFTYLLAREMFGRKAGFLSALLLSLAPAYVLFSVVAMTDVVSLCLTVASVYFLYTGLKKDANFLLGALVSGLAIGVRPQHFIFMLVLLALFVYWKKNTRAAIYSMLVFGASVLLWLVPLLVLSGGPAAYYASLHAEMTGIDRSGIAFVQFKSLARRMLDGWTPVGVLFSALAAAMLFKYRRRSGPGDIMANRPAVLLVAWIAVALLNIMAFENLYTARYILPIFAPVSIIFAFGIVRIGDDMRDKRARIPYYSLISLSILAMAALSFSLVGGIQGSPPAPVQAADYIAGHYGPDGTLIIAGGSYKHFQYYLPGYLIWYNYPGYNQSAGMGRPVVLSDSPLALDASPPVAAYGKADVLNDKHTMVEIYENRMVDHPLIDTGILSAGRPGGTQVWQASGRAAIVYNASADGDVEMRFEAAGLKSPGAMRVYLNGGVAGEQYVPAVADDTGEGTFANVTVPLALKKGINAITISSGEELSDSPGAPRFILRNFTVIR